MKTEHKIIVDLIEEKTRVLDVGCDDGTLMESLKKIKMLMREALRFQRIKFKPAYQKDLL